jgi:type II secretory pathway pseudopilin PulG
LLSVMLIIVMVTAISIGVANYIQQRMAISTAKAQISAMETALEAYKSDFGYYPSSSIGRISNLGTSEGTNNWILYKALFLQGKHYLNFPAAQLRLNQVCIPPLTNMYDPWGSPYVYYCSPTTAYAVLNNAPGPLTGTNTGYTVGGQVNVESYDLFSYGSDRLTYVPGAAYNYGNNSGWFLTGWTNMSSANDDIANWTK